MAFDPAASETPRTVTTTAAHSTLIILKNNRELRPNSSNQCFHRQPPNQPTSCPLSNSICAYPRQPPPGAGAKSRPFPSQGCVAEFLEQCMHLVSANGWRAAKQSRKPTSHLLLPLSYGRSLVDGCWRTSLAGSIGGRRPRRARSLLLRASSAQPASFLRA